MNKINTSELSSFELKESLNFDDLPGLDSQLLLAPPNRKVLMEEIQQSVIDNARIASILILLYRKNGDWYFPAILRNVYKGVHSNQIAMPGGKVESIDKNLAATAIRESWEEIRSNPESVEILGELTELYIPPSNFTMHPFIGIYHEEPNFIPCDHEVQKIIPIKLDDFLSVDAHTSIQSHASGKRSEAPAYKLPDGTIIWGATAMVLSEFYIFIKKSLNL